MKKGVFILVLSFIANVSCLSNNLLSRKRRYLTFPEGSSLSVAICMTAQMGITPGEIFTEGINWGISYELPNDTKSFKDFKKPLASMRRRNRRDLYGKMETIISSMGYNGRSCLLRTLCETSRKLKPKGDSLLDEILNIVFRFPQQKLLPSEPEEHRLYHWASRIGNDGNGDDCAREFPDCPFSLIDMALGYYSAEGFV